MKYKIIFIHNGMKKRTIVDADSELYACQKLFEKSSGAVLIDSCTKLNESKNIMDFLNGIRK